MSTATAPEETVDQEMKSTEPERAPDNDTVNTRETITKEEIPGPSKESVAGPSKKPENDDSKEENPAPSDKPAPAPKIDFTCSVCNLISESCDYFGSRPPFARNLRLTEDSYIMKDPFVPPPTHGKPNPEYFLVLGVNCAFCEVKVCKSTECSFHYSKTFCSKCALENVKQFPLEIQTKIRKQLNKQE